MKPRSQEEARDEAEQIRHRAAADLARARRGQARSSSATRDRQGGLGLEPTKRGASEGAAGLAEPVRSNPSGWTDRWAQAASQPF
jgi:hypothetical protein